MKTPIEPRNLISARYAPDELAEILLSTGKRHIDIEGFIRKRAKTRAIAPLRRSFEDLLKSKFRQNCISAQRTSEIFVTLGTKRGQRNLIYFPCYFGELRRRHN